MEQVDERVEFCFPITFTYQDSPVALIVVLDLFAAHIDLTLSWTWLWQVEQVTMTKSWRWKGHEKVAEMAPILNRGRREKGRIIVLTSDPGLVSSLQPVLEADKNIFIIVYISSRPDTHPIVTIITIVSSFYPSRFLMIRRLRIDWNWTRFLGEEPRF